MREGNQRKALKSGYKPEVKFLAADGDAVKQYRHIVISMLSG